MKPIYFPFTYVSESVGKALSTCFGQITVYQISGAKVPVDMQNLVKDGILDIRIPMEINGDLLDKIHKNYRIWIDTHQGTEIAFLKAMAHKIPFFDENASSQIRAELKKNTPQIQTQERSDPLFNAGLFLHMAQEYDLQNEKLSRDLRDIDAMETDFMKDLKGDEDNIQAPGRKHTSIDPKDPGRYMAAERIEAWASFMVKDPRDFGLFITTSRAVLEHIVDILPETTQINCVDDVPAGEDKDEAWVSWRSEFLKSLEMLAIQSVPAGLDNRVPPPEVSGSKTNVSLTLFMLPDKTPRDCFTGFVGIDALRNGTTKTTSPFKNTLIGLVEMR